MIASMVGTLSGRNAKRDAGHSRAPALVSKGTQLFVCRSEEFTHVTIQVIRMSQYKTKHLVKLNNSHIV